MSLYSTFLDIFCVTIYEENIGWIHMLSIIHSGQALAVMDIIILSIQCGIRRTIQRSFSNFCPVIAVINRCTCQMGNPGCIPVYCIGRCRIRQIVRYQTSITVQSRTIKTVSVIFINISLPVGSTFVGNGIDFFWSININVRTNIKTPLLIVSRVIIYLLINYGLTLLYYTIKYKEKLDLISKSDQV